MIFPDTSVWVAALRSGSGPEAAHLRSLLDADEVALAAPVRVEILAGASGKDRATLRRVLSALPVAYPGLPTWERLDGWVNVAGDAGLRFGFADMLVAGIAADSDSEVWSLDADFDRMSGLGFIRSHRP